MIAPHLCGFSLFNDCSLSQVMEAAGYKTVDITVQAMMVLSPGNQRWAKRMGAGEGTDMKREKNNLSAFLFEGSRNQLETANII